MEKIKFLTDSACDIPQELEEEFEIDIMPIPIAIEGKSYLERMDFSTEEFYDILGRVSEIPVTSHITSPVFLEKYEELYQAGYTNVIHVTICGNGSSMFSAAQVARDLFFEEHPQAKGSFQIDILDSKTYTMAYGYPIIQAAKMARAGESAQKILEYLEDFFNSVEIYFSVFNLDFAKKSGRISCAAAFVGEVLGLRPIISIIDGEIKIISKVRGDKNIVPKLCSLACERREKPGTPFFTLRAIGPEPAQELSAVLEKQWKQSSQGIYYAGASITINAGPRLVGVAVLGKNRAKQS